MDHSLTFTHNQPFGPAGRGVGSQQRIQLKEAQAQNVQDQALLEAQAQNVQDQALLEALAQNVQDQALLEAF